MSASNTPGPDASGQPPEGGRTTSDLNLRKTTSYPRLSALTRKQRLFVLALVDDPSAYGRHAAVQAGWKAGSADFASRRMLKQSEILDAIEEVSQDISSMCVADAAWLLRRLVDDVMFEMGDIIATDTGMVKPVSEWPMRARRMCSKIEIHETFEESNEGGKKTRVWNGQMVKIAFEPRMPRLEKIGRHKSVSAFEADTLGSVLTLELRDFSGERDGGAPYEYVQGQGKVEGQGVLEEGGEVEDAEFSAIEHPDGESDRGGEADPGAGSSAQSTADTESGGGQFDGRSARAKRNRRNQVGDE